MGRQGSQDRPFLSSALPSSPSYGCPRPIVGLIFLVSGRECAFVKVTSMLNGYGGNGGGSRGGGVDGFVPTCVRSMPMLRWGRQATAITMLPSPILAAVSLPPPLLLGRRRRQRRRRRRQPVESLEPSQDFMDRLMRLCVNAFGSNSFPHLELAEALGATFLATSYVGSGGGTSQQGQ
jgi:hypothetical protein